MKIFGIILLLCCPIFGQTEVAQSKNATYYLFKDSVFRTSDTVVFTAVYRKPKMSEFSTIIGNCRTRYFIVTASEIHKGKNVTYYFPTKTTKSVLARKGSAMDHLLTFICTEDFPRQPENPTFAANWQ